MADPRVIGLDLSLASTEVSALMDLTAELDKEEAA